MESSERISHPTITPRIILHGGAGNITRKNIPPPRLALYRASLLRILLRANALLQQPGAHALDVAVHAVAALEDDPLFNCGKGSVFTRAGTNELEASVMVSDGYRKRGTGVMLLERVRNPIRLAKEMLVRGEKEKNEAGGHCQLSGKELEKLAVEWGLEMVEPKYFWTKERWEQHRKGLEKEKRWKESPLHGEQELGLTGDATWDPHEYVPQGTVGAVVLDSFGTIAVATSTGGLTNKLPGRIGDTPTLGAGFWAEEWMSDFITPTISSTLLSQIPRYLDSISRGNVIDLISNCLSSKRPEADVAEGSCKHVEKPKRIRHAVALSGTGNGDSFLRLSACRTAAAICKFSTPNRPLVEAVSQISGPGGELQRSAGDRWGVTGEGEGGIIGIELVGSQGKICWDYNRGMFRAYITDKGEAVFGAFRGDD